MSSAVRSMQKRIFRRLGYVRQTSRIVIVSGQPKVVPYDKGKGPILNKELEPVGRHYPRTLRAFDGKGTPKRNGAARGSRRGTGKQFRAAAA